MPASALSTLVELAKTYGVPAPFATVDEVQRHFWLTRQMSSLKEVLDCFVLFQKLLVSEDVLVRIAREAVEDAAAEKIDQIELRYSPTFTSEFSGISWDSALAAFKRGMDEASARTRVRAGLICIVSRGYAEELMDKTIDFAVAHRGEFIGVDLAGPEEGFPCKRYKSFFARAVAAGMPVTVHAGGSQRSRKCLAGDR